MIRKPWSGRSFTLNRASPDCPTLTERRLNPVVITVPVAIKSNAIGRKLFIFEITSSKKSRGGGGADQASLQCASQGSCLSERKYTRYPGTVKVSYRFGS